MGKNMKLGPINRTELLSVTLLNPETQDAKYKVRRYINTKYTDNIYSAYNKPSSEKIRTFNEIKKEVQDVGGYNLKITGAGCDIYSCAYKLKCDDGTYLIYHTPCNRFAIKLGD